MDIRAVEFAHDMKMPIQLIYSCVQLLEMETQSGSRAEGYLKLLMQSADQLQAMVRSALEDDRLSEGEDSLHLSETELVAHLRDLCAQTAVCAAQKDISVDFFTNVNSFLMRVDGLKLERAIRNLLDNAIRFTPRGGSVKLCLRILGDAAEISVSDTGCGITDAEQIFHRGFTTGGHGHGLAIVRRYARMLGGDVSVHANDGGGSCFVLRLPVRN